MRIFFNDRSDPDARPLCGGSSARRSRLQLLALFTSEVAAWCPRQNESNGSSPKCLDFSCPAKLPRRIPNCVRLSMELDAWR